MLKVKSNPSHYWRLDWKQFGTNQAGTVAEYLGTYLPILFLYRLTDFLWQFFPPHPVIQLNKAKGLPDEDVVTSVSPVGQVDSWQPLTTANPATDNRRLLLVEFGRKKAADTAIKQFNFGEIKESWEFLET